MNKSERHSYQHPFFVILTSKVVYHILQPRDYDIQNILIGVKKWLLLSSGFKINLVLYLYVEIRIYIKPFRTPGGHNLHRLTSNTH